MRVDWAGAIENENLGKIFIGGEEFTGIGYQGLMTVNTKTYVEEPTRANDGSIPNIDDHDTFIVPRCKVNFKFFNIRDYQRLCRVINSANQFPVSYFDKQFGEHRTYMMYVEPEEMAKIYNVGTSVIGVLDYEVSFIGTLNNLDKFNVRYVSKYWNGTDLVPLEEKYLTFDEERTYYKGRKVFWQDNYYEAIYEDYMFSGITPPNTQYWLSKQPTEWENTQTYVADDFVYIDTESSNGTVRKYYRAKKDEAIKGIPPTDEEYWETVIPTEYSPTKTYSSKKNDYVYIVDGDNRTFYEANYYVNYFSGETPDNQEYWKKISPVINVNKEVSWGSSIHVLKESDLLGFYNSPPGGVLKEWNTSPDGEGLRLLPGTNWSVFEDLTIYPIFESSGD